MSDPHAEAPIRTAGADLSTAEAGVIMVHGRGATATSILELASAFDARGVAYLAPQASGNTWYPNSFLAPVDSNEPGLSSGLNTVRRALDTVREAGVDRDRTLLLGFSQGACLASEFVARNPARYGGLVAFSGGLIGPDVDESDYGGSLDEMPVFVGCSDVDPHIPLERVQETSAVFRGLGATVDERIYEGMGHQVNQDELDRAAEMIRRLTR